MEKNVWLCAPRYLLIDGTIKENITFAEENNLDKEFMNEIIRMSKLDELSIIYLMALKVRLVALENLYLEDKNKE